MVISADTLRLAYVFEATRGTTPPNPHFDILRVTGEGLTFNPTATFSNEMDTSRAVRDSILTGGEVSGDINFELSYNVPWMELLEGAFCSSWGDFPAGMAGTAGLNEFGPEDDLPRVWGDDDLIVGQQLKTWTFEKRFNKDGGGFVYQRYNGCVVNTFSLNLTPNEPISGSFGIIGAGMTLSETALAGSLYDQPGSEPVFTSLKVTDIAFYTTSSGNVVFDDYCFNGLTINLNNNARRTACIGPDTFAQVVLGRCEITWDANIYFNDNKLLEWLQDQDDVVLIVNLRDTASPAKHKFIFRAPRAKTQSGSIVASGTGQDVIANATFAALIPANDKLGPMSVSRETLPPGEG